MSKSYPWATAIFLDAMSKQHQTCSICWSGPDDDKDQELLVCNLCQVRVHPTCCFGKKLFDSQWCCDSCLDYKERASDLPPSLTALNVRWARKCGLCDQFGSAVEVCQHTSSKGNSRIWAHVSCRIWERSKAFEEGDCVLCSRTSKYLVRCAAVGCTLRFHPMCASIASYAAAVRRVSNPTFPVCVGSMEKEEDVDIFLCTQYSQDLACVSLEQGKAKKWSFPVAYCGIHNPHRAPDRWGLLPGAAHFKDSTRLPLARHQTDS